METIISRCEDTMQYAPLLQDKVGLPLQLFIIFWQQHAGFSAFVHACNNGHMTVYKEQYYSNGMVELSEGRGNWGGDKKNTRANGTVL